LLESTECANATTHHWVEAAESAHTATKIGRHLRGLRLRHVRLRILLSAPSESIELPTKPILLEPTILRLLEAAILRLLEATTESTEPTKLWLLESTEPTELRLLESAEL
jgi:hypothetical protein